MAHSMHKEMTGKKTSPFSVDGKGETESQLKMIETTDLFSHLKKMRILLIDDDEWVRDSLRLFFEAEGCSLLALETAEEGLAALKRECFDLIITDYRLPGMDGVTFLDRIQARCPDALKVVITAYGSPQAISWAKRIGAHDFIEKPFTSETLEESLSRLVSATRRKGEVS